LLAPVGLAERVRIAVAGFVDDWVAEAEFVFVFVAAWVACSLRCGGGCTAGVLAAAEAASAAEL
jgi:hypothetical protein